MGKGHKPSALVSNYHSASNRGDAAILEGLREILSDTEFELQGVMTEYPDAARNINQITAFEQKTTPFRLDRPFRTAAYLITTLGLNKGVADSWVNDKLNLAPYRKADWIIGTGGHYLTDVYYPGKLGLLWEIQHCNRIGKNVILLGQSFGPIENKLYRQITRRILNKVDIITVRDRRSYENLREMGVDTEVRLTADLAFSMDTKKADTSLNRVEEDPDIRGDPAISISVRDWPYFDRGGMETYLSGIASICKELVRDRGATVYFLSTCTGYGGYHTDDRIPANKVCDRLPEDIEDNTHIVSGEYTPQELIRFYSDIDFHIGTRMHSLVLAILAKTPVIGIEYQFKTTGMMEMFDLENYVMSIENVDEDSGPQFAMEGIQDKEIIQQRVESSLPKVREKANQNTKIIQDLLQ